MDAWLLLWAMVCWGCNRAERDVSRIPNSELISFSFLILSVPGVQRKNSGGGVDRDKEVRLSGQQTPDPLRLQSAILWSISSNRVLLAALVLIWAKIQNSFYHLKTFLRLIWRRRALHFFVGYFVWYVGPSPITKGVEWLFAICLYPLLLTRVLSHETPAQASSRYGPHWYSLSAR